MSKARLVALILALPLFLLMSSGIWYKMDCGLILLCGLEHMGGDVQVGLQIQLCGLLLFDIQFLYACHVSCLYDMKCMVCVPEFGFHL